ncbi:MAG: UDP-N-acetylmuramate--L-alanine ligase [Anaeromicrobium sp.]|uniref:UDP-N-acetylmuramate--L-alanine ligase n=1 Tax=Anaeromicrobium sp. TaxID=1929132 RepID=UPI0025D8F1FC|nr:UDP-N-acetylmuramate--L-alanine ligase [Anaeromicrobium sp.]MCT4594035.1 UDP-N-acetylmuramate--L-alanine ligase [Anaeromicrobium sp.]
MFDFDLDKHSINHIHFIGIGGISMSALAQILINFDYKVTGSDMNDSEITKKLSSQGATIHMGHNKNNISNPDLVVYTAAVKENNPELVEARTKEIPILSRAEMLGLLMKKFKNNIAVAGTHGKTTTTSMISVILDYNKYSPTILVGGQLDNIGGNVKVGSRDYFVTEACEYVGSFLKFFPTIGIILNIEEDHLDYFKDLDHIKETFKEFIDLIPKDGLLIAYGDDPNIQSIIDHVHCNLVTYGKDNNSDYYPSNISFNDLGYPSFDLYKRDEFLGKINLKVPGEHNLFNSLASIACCHHFGIDIDHINEALNTFGGTHRRFDLLGHINNIKIVDDYAHHPTEIEATLKALSNMDHNNLWCVFQPHTFTRTLCLLDEFSQALAEVDNLIITDIYAAREKDTGEIHSKDLVKKIKKHNDKVKYMKEFDSIVNYIYENAKPNDLVITMGAGNVNSIGEQLVQKLKG